MSVCDINVQFRGLLGNISEAQCYLKWNANANVPLRGISTWGMLTCLSCWNSPGTGPCCSSKGGQCPQPVAHGVAAAPCRQPAPLCGLGELSDSHPAYASRENLTTLQLWGLCLRRGSHTRTNTKGKPSVCRAEPWITAQDTAVMTEHGWRTTAFELAARTWYKRYHICQATAVLSDWRLHHHSDWKTKKFSAKNPQRCSVLASQLVLFFLDLSSIHLLFPTLTIKHFPLTLCRALLKKSLV